MHTHVHPSLRTVCIHMHTKHNPTILTPPRTPPKTPASPTPGASRLTPTGTIVAKKRARTHCSTAHCNTMTTRQQYPQHNGSPCNTAAVSATFSATRWKGRFCSDVARWYSTVGCWCSIFSTRRRESRRVSWYAPAHRHTSTYTHASSHHLPHSSLCIISPHLKSTDPRYSL